MTDEATALAALAQAAQVAKAVQPSAPGVLTDDPADYVPLDVELYASLVAEMSACPDQHQGFLLAVSWQSRKLSGPDVAMAVYCREKLPRAAAHAAQSADRGARMAPAVPPGFKLFTR